MGTKSRMVVAGVMMASLLSASIQLPAKARQGARVIVERKDGATVSGELLMVKRDCLVVDGQGGGVIVGLGDVHLVRIVKKSMAGAGLLVGLVGGTLVGYGMGRESPGCQSREQSATLSFLFLGLPCGVLGALLGVALGKDSVLEKDKMKPFSFLFALNRCARVYDLSLVIGH